MIYSPSGASPSGINSSHQSPYALRRKLSPQEAPSSPGSNNNGLNSDSPSNISRKRQKRSYSSSQSATDG